MKLAKKISSETNNQCKLLNKTINKQSIIRIDVIPCHFILNTHISQLNYKFKMVKKLLQLPKHYKKLRSFRDVKPYIKFIKKVINMNCELLSNYRGQKVPVLIKHKSKQCKYYKNHHRFQVIKEKPKSFLNRRNPFKHYIQKLTLPIYNKRLKKASHNKLRAVKLVHLHKNGRPITIAVIQCLKCKRYFKKEAKKFLNDQKTRCPFCTSLKGTNQYSQKQFERELIQRRGYQFVPGIYQGSFVKIPFLCEKCDKIFYAEPNEMLRKGRRHKMCPNCKVNICGSFGELSLKKLFNLYHIKYYYGYHLHTSLSHNKSNDLRADFYLPDIKYSNKYYKGTVFEFDGYQHFHTINWSGNMSKQYQLDRLFIRQIYDCVKNIYCQKHHIKMIRVQNKTRSRDKLEVIFKFTFKKIKPFLEKFGHINKDDKTKLKSKLDSIHSQLC